MGDEGDMATVRKDEAAELSVNEKAKRGRSAVDQMAPRGDEGGVDAETASANVAAADR